MEVAVPKLTRMPSCVCDDDSILMCGTPALPCHISGRGGGWDRMLQVQWGSRAAGAHGLLREQNQSLAVLGFHPRRRRAALSDCFPKQDRIGKRSEFHLSNVWVRASAVPRLQVSPRSTSRAQLGTLTIPVVPALGQFVVIAVVINCQMLIIASGRRSLVSRNILR